MLRSSRCLFCKLCGCVFLSISPVGTVTCSAFGSVFGSHLHLFYPSPDALENGFQPTKGKHQHQKNCEGQGTCSLPGWLITFGTVASKSGSQGSSTGSSRENSGSGSVVHSRPGRTACRLSSLAGSGGGDDTPPDNNRPVSYDPQPPEETRLQSVDTFLQQQPSALEGVNGGNYDYCVAERTVRQPRSALSDKKGNFSETEETESGYYEIGHDMRSVPVVLNPSSSTEGRVHAVLSNSHQATGWGTNSYVNTGIQTPARSKLKTREAQRPPIPLPRKKVSGLSSERPNPHEPVVQCQRNSCYELGELLRPLPPPIGSSLLTDVPAPISIPSLETSEQQMPPAGLIETTPDDFTLLIELKKKRLKSNLPSMTSEEVDAWLLDFTEVLQQQLENIINPWRSSLRNITRIASLTNGFSAQSTPKDGEWFSKWKEDHTRVYSVWERQLYVLVETVLKDLQPQQLSAICSPSGNHDILVRYLLFNNHGGGHFAFTLATSVVMHHYLGLVRDSQLSDSTTFRNIIQVLKRAAEGLNKRNRADLVQPLTVLLFHNSIHNWNSLNLLKFYFQHEGDIIRGLMMMCATIKQSWWSSSVK